MIAMRLKDQTGARLAYELVFAAALGEAGFHDAALARAWARYWLTDPDRAGEIGAAARDLTAQAIALDLPLSTIAQVHCGVLGREIRQLLLGDPELAGTTADWVAGASARLTLLLACVEGERVCAALTPAGDASEAVTALADAAEVLARSLNKLRPRDMPASPRRSAA